MFFERPDPRGARPKHDKKRLVEAVFYRLREGCRWRALLHDLPSWSTVASHFLASVSLITGQMVPTDAAAIPAASL